MFKCYIPENDDEFDTWGGDHCVYILTCQQQQTAKCSNVLDVHNVLKLPGHDTAAPS